jgi:hypothetical protein
MIKKKKTCVECNAVTYIFSKGRCGYCAKKGYAKKTIDKEKGRIENQVEFFKSIWNKRPHFCAETSETLYPYTEKGREIGIEISWFHHILPKKKFPEFANREINVIILSAMQHSRIECGSSSLVKKMSCFPIIKNAISTLLAELPENDKRKINYTELYLVD